jgi:type IV pilus assembly protein PilA
MLNRQKGFTLIELLVVIAIIGILATLVITQVASAQVRARNSSSQSDIAEAGKAVEVWKTTQSSDNVVIKNANTTAAAVPAVNLNASTVAGAWTTVFSGTEGAGSYGTSITKTPSASYTYGYQTDTTGANYCIGTNSVNASGVTGTLGFIINNGSSRNAAAAAPNYGGVSAAATLPCT